MSSGWKVFLIVVAVLLVAGLLVGGGFGLYRLGFARGLAAAGTLGELGQLPREYGWGMMRGFDDGRLPYMPHGGMMIYGGHMPFGVWGFGGWIIPLLLLAGVITLIVLGIRALTHSHPVEVQAVAAPPAPAALAATNARPTRGARRTKAS